MKDSSALSFGFALTGVMTTLLGPLMPSLSARWGLNDAQAGSLFTAQFTAATVGTLLSGMILGRLGYTRSLAGGYGLLAAGALLLGFGSWRLGVLSIIGYGFALGVTIPLTNLLISALNPTRRAAALNRLNVAWGLGAVSTPVLLEFLGQDHPRRTLLGVALLSTIVAAWIFRIKSPDLEKQDRPAAPPQSSFQPNPLTFLYSLMAYLYVGTENAIAGWIASYAQRIEAGQSSLWAFTPTIFWAALLAGRLAAPAALKHVTESRLILLGLGLAVAGSAALLLFPTLLGLFLGAAIAGLGLAPVFPTTIAMFTQAFGAASSRVSGLIFASGGFGGATVPWIVGLLSTAFGGLRAGLVFPLVAAFFMIALQRPLDRLSRRADP